MRLLALFVMCVPVAAAGGMLAARRRRRERALAGFAAFFANLSQTRGCFGGALRPLLRLAVPEKESGFTFGACLLHACAELTPAAAWEIAVRGSAESAVLLPEEREFLLDFADAFGESSLNGFHTVCAAYAQRFALLAKQARARNDKSEKTCVTLSVLLAALLFIILV